MLGVSHRAERAEAVSRDASSRGAAAKSATYLVSQTPQKQRNHGLCSTTERCSSTTWRHCPLSRAQAERAPHAPGDRAATRCFASLPSPTNSYTMAESLASESLALDSLFSVQGKTALVTGGGSGIGLMIATALATNGATVYIVGRRKEKLEEVAAAWGTSLTSLPSRSKAHRQRSQTPRRPASSSREL